MDKLLTKEFLQGLHPGKEIESISTRPGSKPGDNYTSVLIAIDLRFRGSHQEEHLLIKLFPQAKDQRQFLLESQIFTKEIKVYQIWFQKLQELVQGTQISLPFPPYIAGAATESIQNGEVIGDLDNFLLMVDVRKTGDFRMSKERLVDGPHCNLLVVEMAKMHALSWVYKQKSCSGGPLQEKYPFLRENLYIEDSRSVYQNFLNNNYPKFLKTLEVAFGEDSPLVKSYAKLGKRDLIGELVAFCKKNVDLEELEGFLRVRSLQPGEIKGSEPWRMIIHSDAWSNNMLFHYNLEGIPDKLIFVDFQFISEQCPTLDLAFFFYITTEYSLRKELPKFLRIYHESFLEITSTFGVPPPKNFEDFSHFCKRFRTAKYFAFITVILWFGLVFEPVQDGPEEDKQFAFDKVQVDLEKIGAAQGGLAIFLTELAKELYEDGLI